MPRGRLKKEKPGQNHNWPRERPSFNITMIASRRDYDCRSLHIEMERNVKMQLPKAELHVHLECSIGPNRARILAAKNKIDIPSRVFDAKGNYYYKDFPEFLKLTEIVGGCLLDERDYYDITWEYLGEAAAQGVVYQELIFWPGLAVQNGLSGEVALDAIKQAIADAQEGFGIKTVVQIVLVRHYGPEDCERVAKWAVSLDDPIVRGVNLAGNEITHPADMFKKAFQIAQDGGLQGVVHAGEAMGPQSVWAALEIPGISRIGHGVRSIEDSSLVQELVERGVTLEVCPTSNICTGIYSDLSAHPLRELYAQGVTVTLNSDDPPYFFSTLAQEYGVAKNVFGFSDEELFELTRNAIKAGMLDSREKAALLARVDGARS